MYQYPEYMENNRDKTYPCMVVLENNGDGIFAHAFETELGHEELCHPTGRMLQLSTDPSDHWIEFEDSFGELHYGR